MSWDTVSAIGEIVGALAVVISVCYLAIQIRKQTEESRLTATRELAAQHQDVLKLVAADQHLAEIWLKAVRDYKSMPEVERLRASFLFHDSFRNYEQQFVHVQNGNAEVSYLASLDRVFLDNLSFPGVQQWWESSKHGFADEFQDHVQKMISEATKLRRSSTFKTQDENIA